MVPASTSGWVAVYVAVHAMDCPGANEIGAACGQLTADRPSSGSVIATSVRPMFPVLVAVNV